MVPWNSSPRRWRWGGGVLRASWLERSAISMHSGLIARPCFNDQRGRVIKNDSWHQPRAFRHTHVHTCTRAHTHTHTHPWCKHTHMYRHITHAGNGKSKAESRGVLSTLALLLLAEGFPKISCGWARRDRCLRGWDCPWWILGRIWICA